LFFTKPEYINFLHFEENEAEMGFYVPSICWTEKGNKLYLSGHL